MRWGASVPAQADGSNSTFRLAFTSGLLNANEVKNITAAAVRLLPTHGMCKATGTVALGVAAAPGAFAYPFY